MQNVIPAEASATLDCRLLPGQDAEAFLAHLHDVIADDSVEIETVYRYDPFRAELRPSLIEHVEETIRHETDGGVVIPMLTPGMTVPLVLSHPFPTSGCLTCCRFLPAGRARVVGYFPDDTGTPVRAQYLPGLTGLP